MPEAASLPRFTRSYDWDAIDRAVQATGGAIAEGFLRREEVSPLNREIDAYLESHAGSASPTSGSPLYDFFLGHKTLRLHGLIEKIPSSAELLARAELVAWAERAMAPTAASILLNAGELIQIEPGEPAQIFHRDSDSWPVPVGEHPIIVNALVALDACTTENGATTIAPDSWRWETGRQPEPEELARAVMEPGDAVLFRGDVIHRGGANESDCPRRLVSISYCAGWLRPVENSFLNVSQRTARRLPRPLQRILGYSAHDNTANLGGIVGLYENGDPASALGDGVSVSE